VWSILRGAEEAEAGAPGLDGAADGEAGAEIGHAGVGVEGGAGGGHRLAKTLDVGGGPHTIEAAGGLLGVVDRVGGVKGGRELAAEVAEGEAIARKTVADEAGAAGGGRVGAEAGLDLEGELFGDLAALELGGAAGEVARDVRGEGLLDVDRAERGGGEDVEGDGAQVGVGAGDAGAVEEGVAITMTEAANKEEAAADDGDADDPLGDRGGGAAAGL
jgi:hypothetical protein